MRIFIFLLINIVVVIHCAIAQTPVISGFSPVNGAVGSTVVISGSNFSATPSGNIVFFGATKATVSAASTTQLTVVVPAGASYQPISVTVNSLTGYSKQPFIVTFLSNRIVKANYFSNSISLDAPSMAQNFVVVDLDVDGKPDVANVSGFFNKITVFRNITTGSSMSFDFPFTLLPGTQPYDLAVGDLDGDGKIELFANNVATNNISIFANISAPGTLTASSFSKTDFAVATAPEGVASGDLNGDGKLDLAVSTFNGAVSLGTNATTGSGIAAGSFTFSDLSISFDGGRTAIGDLDGDGKPDMVVSPYTNYDPGQVTVFRNTSSGGALSASSFGTNFQLTTPAGTTKPFIFDIDLDGKPEVLVPSTFGTVSVFPNTSTPGTISFGTKVDLTTGANCSGVGVGDLDGDGKPDIVATNNANNSISVYRNNGVPGTINAASFDMQVVIGNPDLNIPNAANVTDMDGDGKPEILISNTGNGDVVILKNKMPLPPPIINSVAPGFGPAGAVVTITGLYFDPVISNNIVAINGATASVTSASATQLVVVVPPAATTGLVSVTIGDQSGSSVSPFIVAPKVNTITPASAAPGSTVVITGLNFSTTLADNIVKFGGVAATVTAATITQLTVTIPVAAVTGQVSVTVSSQTAVSAASFTVGPSISSFTPTIGAPGMLVVISGLNFSATPSANTIKFNLATAQVVSSTSTSITARIPDAATTGKIIITTNGLSFTSINNFTIDLTLGLEDSGYPLTLYPNPAKETATLNTSRLQRGIRYDVHIFDLTGKQIEENSGIGGNDFVLDLRGYHGGLYLMKVLQEGKTFTIKFFKQ